MVGRFGFFLVRVAAGGCFGAPRQRRTEVGTHKHEVRPKPKAATKGKGLGRNKAPLSDTTVYQRNMMLDAILLT